MLEQGDLFVNNHPVCSHSARTETSTSECLDCHMQLWNKRKTFVIANSWKRSRVILIDVQCSECLLNWNEGLVFCTNGHLLKESEASHTFSTTAAGYFLNRELRYQEGATSRCSARQNWSTERAFHSQQCSKEMSRKEIWRNSRSFLKKTQQDRDSQLKIGWTEETCVANRKIIPIVHCLESSRDIGKLVFHHEQIRKKCTNETPIRLPRSTYLYAPSSPWIWRRATWTNSFSSIQKVAFVVFFIQFLMVSVGWTRVELIKKRLSMASELMQWAASKNRETNIIE